MSRKRHEPPKEVDGCKVFFGGFIELDSGRESSLGFLYPLEDEDDPRVWEWSCRTGKAKLVAE